MLRACEEFTRGAPHGGPSSERGGVNHDELPPELRNEEAPLELDALLTELAIVCQRCVSFGRLMRGKAAHIDAVAAAAAQAEQMRQERRRRGQSAYVAPVPCAVAPQAGARMRLTSHRHWWQVGRRGAGGR